MTGWLVGWFYSVPTFVYFSDMPKSIVSNNMQFKNTYSLFFKYVILSCKTIVLKTNVHQNHFNSISIRSIWPINRAQKATSTWGRMELGVIETNKWLNTHDNWNLTIWSYPGHRRMGLMYVCTVYPVKTYVRQPLISSPVYIIPHTCSLSLSLSFIHSLTHRHIRIQTHTHDTLSLSLSLTHSYCMYLLFSWISSVLAFMKLFQWRCSGY